MGKSVWIVLGTAGVLGVITTGWATMSQAQADRAQITPVTCSEAHAVGMCPKKAAGDAVAPACHDTSECDATVLLVADETAPAAKCEAAKCGGGCDPLKCDSACDEDGCDPLTCDPTNCKEHGDKGCADKCAAKDGKGPQDGCPGQCGQDCPHDDCPGQCDKDCSHDCQGQCGKDCPHEGCSGQCGKDCPPEKCPGHDGADCPHDGCPGHGAAKDASVADATPVEGAAAAKGSSCGRTCGSHGS